MSTKLLAAPLPTVKSVKSNPLIPSLKAILTGIIPEFVGSGSVVLRTTVGAVLSEVMVN